MDRPGVYRVKGYYADSVYYAYWDGSLWSWREYSIKDADQNRNTEGADQFKWWAGLTEEAARRAYAVFPDIRPRPD